VVGAWAVGAPHRRDRVWIVGKLVDPSHGRSRTPARSSHIEGRRPSEAGPSDLSERPLFSANDWTSGSYREELADAASGRFDGHYATESRPGWRHPNECDPEELADASCERRTRAGIDTDQHGKSTTSGGGSCWPARPGEPQHEWEAPRLAQFPMGGAGDGLPIRLVRFANRNALRAYGNSVVPQVVEVIGRAIKESGEE
jgi:DNA (cytosine-5)-methyltransferase 1